jgi:hypothetical protein
VIGEEGERGRKKRGERRSKGTEQVSDLGLARRTKKGQALDKPVVNLAKLLCK